MDWRIFCGVVLLGNAAVENGLQKLVCIDILASLSFFAFELLSDSSTGIRHLGQAFPVCTRYVRFALVL